MFWKKKNKETKNIPTIPVKVKPTSPPPRIFKRTTVDVNVVTNRDLFTEMEVALLALLEEYRIKIKNKRSEFLTNLNCFIDSGIEKQPECLKREASELITLEERKRGIWEAVHLLSKIKRERIKQNETK